MASSAAALADFGGPGGPAGTEDGPDEGPAASGSAPRLPGPGPAEPAEDPEGTKSATTSSETNPSNTPTCTDSMSDDTGFPLDTADEKDEVSSTVSDISYISGISRLSYDGDGSLEWRNASTWVQKQIQMGTDPRDVLKLLFSDPSQIPEQVDDITLWRIVINMMSEPPKRQKLNDFNTILDVVKLIRKSKNIIVLTGAGVSVSCGIPDFRSRDGIYSRLAQDFPDLPDPQAMFDINYFSQDPRPFYKFAREIYPGQFKPSPCHEFIKMLEKQGKLLRNYSQNIDTLERVCGIENLIECHGSFATASCTKCKYQVPSDDIRQDIFAQTIPMCPKCQEQALPSIAESNSSDNYRDLVAQGVMKPDIVFFGEGLPDAFHEAMANDKDACDLLIVMGSSLKVRPVALIPSSIPPHVPQILINRESLSHLEFDIELLGDGDVVINQLCHMLDGCFKKLCWRDAILEEAQSLLPPEYPLNDAWEQSQDTLTNQDFSQDSTQIEDENFLEPRSAKLKREQVFDQEDSTTIDRPWKKVKTSNDSKKLYEDESNSCTKYYPNIENYYEKKASLIDEDVAKNINSDSDDDCVSNNISTSQNHKESTSGKNSKKDLKESCILDDRQRKKEESKRKNKVMEEYLQENTLSDNECTDVRNLSFHSELSEHTVKNFTFMEKTEERQLTNSSFDRNVIRHDIEKSLKSIETLRGKSMTLSSGESPTTSNESSSRATEEIFISEDCHVVPRIDCLRDDSTLEENLENSKGSDKIDLKPRHASIDSVMDSALGDSCSSSDCQKRKNDVDNTDDEKKFNKLDSNLWQSTERESLASRLPENSYFQLKPGKYIFPGAEVYTNFPWNEGVLQIGGLRSTLTSSQFSEH